MVINLDAILKIAGIVALVLASIWLIVSIW
jgi:hypothetical protein